LEAETRRNKKLSKFRKQNGHSWDCCIIWKVRKEEESLTPLQNKNSIKKIINKLQEAGLQASLFYSCQFDEVYCKIRAPVKRLLQEAMRIKYRLELDPVELRNVMENGREDLWKGVEMNETHPDTRIHLFTWESLNPFHTSAVKAEDKKHLYISPYDHIFLPLLMEPKLTPDEIIMAAAATKSMKRVDEKRIDLKDWYKIYKKRELPRHTSKRTSIQEETLSTLHLSRSATPNSFSSDAVDQDWNTGIFKGSDRLRLICNIIRAREFEGGCELDLRALQLNDCICGFICLQDHVELTRLEAKWIKLFEFPWNQDVDAVSSTYSQM
jgi:hypothetical protein